ncbi:Protein phosphatase [Plasmodiophora brassicae]|uniref:Protein phosphatase n=2 Tax=Plasmodiophora brassicae TaxID=37360 RepID=A0A3P3YCG5_PLABS|nr:unnamed protein product [Plasmodiophora brassicae]
MAAAAAAAAARVGRVRRRSSSRESSPLMRDDGDRAKKRRQRPVVARRIWVLIVVAAIVIYFLFLCLPLASLWKASRGTVSLEFGGAVTPHPDKVDRGGEDAYFYSSAIRAFAVADGVGGWNEQGVNPGLFSRALLQHVWDAFTEYPGITPVAAMRKALGKVRARQIQGSSTVVLGVLGKDNVLTVSNLGDSGLLLLRKQSGSQGYTKLFKTPEQQHQFNFPYQVALDAHASDPPESAETTTHPLRPGDLIIAGSDGLFDNLYVSEIVNEVSTTAVKSLNELAANLVQKAHEFALLGEKGGRSPFGDNARAAGKRWPGGGKLDDIVVVVARVVEAKVPEHFDSNLAPPV